MWKTQVLHQSCFLLAMPGFRGQSAFAKKDGISCCVEEESGTEKDFKGNNSGTH